MAFLRGGLDDELIRERVLKHFFGLTLKGPKIVCFFPLFLEFAIIFNNL